MFFDYFILIPFGPPAPNALSEKHFNRNHLLLFSQGSHTSESFVNYKIILPNVGAVGGNTVRIRKYPVP